MALAKPTVALDLSNEAISVWHWKGAAGWTAVGNVVPTDPDLSQKLEDLQRRAGGGLGTRVPTAVRIPRTEVMVTRVSLSVFEGEAAAAHARKAVADMTPYDLDQISFDLGAKGAGNTAPVAIVARQTLEEAENFSRQHGFEPIYFTTHYGADEFPREPRFDVARPKQADVPVVPRWALSGVAAALLLAMGYLGVSALTASDPTAGTGPELADTPATETSTAVARATDDSEVAVLPPVSPDGAPFVASDLQASLNNPNLGGAPDLRIERTGRIAPHPYQRLAYVDPVHGDSLVELSRFTGDQKSQALIAAEALRDLPEVALDDAAATALEAALQLAPPSTVAQVDAPVTLAALPNPSVIVDVPDRLNPILLRDVLPSEEAQEPAAPAPPPPGLTADPGEVVPTPVGTIGPEGIRVFSGRPPVESRKRPGGVVPLDPLLAFRPKARPEGLVSAEQLAALAASNAVDEPVETPGADPIAAAIGDAVIAAIEPESQTDAQPLDAGSSDLLARADPTLRGVRAKQRPGGFADINTTLQEDAEDQPANTFAVAISPKPTRRPDKIATLAAARAKEDADTKATASTPEDARGTAKPAPGPTANAVARNATEPSNFSKSRMSLVGVFGTPSDRRALVRLSSGRYVKVQTGDRVSGWQVSAIGESTLRINRGQRNQVLRMP